MLKNLLLTMLGLIYAGTQIWALDGGDYIYTRTARYKVNLESENLVTNGYFTVTDYTSSSFGWTDADGSNIGTNMAIEPSAGPNGENVLMSTSTSESSLKQAIPFEGGKQYIITMKIKGPSNGPTYFSSSTSNNYVDVYAVKDADGDQDDDNNYQTIATYDCVTTSWGDITFAFADESGDDGYIVILLKRLTEETLVGNFEVREATQVGDDREINTLLEDAQMLIESGEFTEDNSGFADAVEGVYYSGIEDPSIWDEIDNATSMVTELSALQEEWMDETSCDMSDYFSSFDPYNWSAFNNNTGTKSVGSWKFSSTASRWGHTSGSYYGSYAYPSNYSLGWGNAELWQTDMPAGRYMFSLTTYAKKTTSGVDKSGSTSYYIDNYSYYVTNGAYIYFGDTKLEIDTMANYSGKKYYVFGDLAEGDTLKAGFYFPGFGDSTGSDGGGYFYFGYPEIRFMGLSAEDAENQLYVEDIATQQAALLAQLEAAQALLNTLPWGNDTLQTTIDTYTSYYNASLLYVTADGELADGIDYDDIPEDYDDLLSTYKTIVSSVRSYYTSLNEPYSDLVELVETAEAYLVDETMSSASSTSRAALQSEIDEANALIDAATSEVQTDEFEAAYEELSSAIQDFRFSCASFTNPGEIEYTNNSFQLQSSSGWDVSGSSYWKYHTDTNFADGYSAYIWRGYTAWEKGKIRREVTVTEPGVYEFYCQAYAMNHYASYYNTLWNGLTGEDSVRSANINVFFGFVDEAETVDVLTYQENFSTNWLTYDELRDFTILYTKTTDASVEETLEFGFNALQNGYDDDGNSLGAGCNSYGFGSTHIYYFGSEETYADGIASAKAEEIQADDYVYSLSGVRVGKASDNLPKGVYIAKGKKFIVK